MSDVGKRDAFTDISLPETIPVRVRSSHPAALWLWLSFRKTLLTIHLWSGIVLAIPLILIGLSGSALIIQREVLWLSIPSATAAGNPQSLAKMIASARSAMPAKIRPTFIGLPEKQGKPAIVQFDLSRNPTRTNEVYIDPVSLAVLGTADWIRRGPINLFLINMHGFLMMGRDTGFAVVGWLGIAMTLMGLSGLILWWPRKGQGLSAFCVRRTSRGLRLHLDLHHAVGIWGMVIFLVISVSGVYLVYPIPFVYVVRGIFPTEAAEPIIPSVHENAVGHVDADFALTVGQKAVPDARAIGVQLPANDRAPYVVQLERSGWRPSSPAITVMIDQKTGEILNIDDLKNYSLADRILNYQYVLHFSVGVSWIWTFIVFLSGLLPLFLAVTGISIWWLKRRTRSTQT